MSASEFPEHQETGKNTPEDGDWHQDMTSRAVLLAQARQGDPTAIATWINQSLKTQNVTIQVRQKGELYQILVPSPSHGN
ncbi:hypothetical protein D0962_06190 [Leptolyngbyaceae cyanobacterium CCMR0082]|uniref:Uncharacterized protein n=1 Tax=Adonisia turfae CCMR0082 TaxID=2304604 RepID=A0A6M0S320_9CYAN|nr:hypothetical protein [Adonisia turfae]NEZ62371.1 hypothetical protein [Adonisia turfae CCMR0082]